MHLLGKAIRKTEKAAAKDSKDIVITKKSAGEKYTEGEKSIAFWHRFFWVMLILCLIPLAMIAVYNHASADDYAFSNYPHHGWLANGLLGFLSGVLQQLHWSYTSWQGCFTAVLLGALDPVAFGDSWYGICAYLLIGFLVLSNVIFCRRIFCGKKGTDQRRCGNVIACILTITMIQLVPRALDMFFWWDGAVNYLPFYGMLLILLAFLVKVLRSGKIPYVQMVLAAVLSFFAMGGNYVTALVNLLCLFFFGGLLWYMQRDSGKGHTTFRSARIIYVIVLLSGCAGLAVSVLAPGNALRMAQEGTTGITSIPAMIIHSVYLAYEGVIGNMSILLILFQALLLPFYWQYLNELERPQDLSGDCRETGKVQNPSADSKGISATDRKSRCTKGDNDECAAWERFFRIPTVIVVIILFGIYAASYAPTVYVYGDGGPMRVEDVRFLYLVILLAVLELFLTGKVWLLGRDWNWRLYEKRERYLVSVLVLLAGFTLFGYVLPRENREELTSVCAARSLLIGEAQQYDSEMKARYEQLSDPSAEGEDVVVKAASVRPYLLFLYGLELTEDPEYWINETVATYYDKASVTLEN